MKKSTVAGGVIVVLAGAWLGGTWYTGKRLEAEAPARLAELNQRLARVYPDYGMKIEQVSFQRGFFSSHARYGLSMVGKDQDLGHPQLPEGALQVDVTADHGPFPLQALAHGDLAPQLAWVHSEIVQTDALKPMIDGMWHGKTPASSDMALSYGGNTRSTLNIAPFDATYQGHKIAFGGAQARSTYIRATQDIESTTQFASLAYDGANLGGGQLTLKANPTLLVIDPLVWKTDKGEGRIMMTATGKFPQPGPGSAADAGAYAPDAKPALDSLTAKIVLSKAMLNELTSRYFMIAQGKSQQDADKEAEEQVTAIAGMGAMLGFVRDDGNNLATDIQFGKGKLSINGHEQDASQLEQMMPGLGDGDDNDDEDDAGKGDGKND